MSEGRMAEKLDEIFGDEAEKLLRVVLGDIPSSAIGFKLLVVKLRRQLAYSMYNLAQCATQGDERQVLLAVLKLQIDRELGHSKEAGLL